MKFVFDGEARRIQSTIPYTQSEVPSTVHRIFTNKRLGTPSVKKTQGVLVYCVSPTSLDFPVDYIM